MASVTLSNASKSFGKVKVLDDISLSIEDGEFAAFVGPSGCGKSTLLRLIAGLEEMSGGQLRIDDVCVNSVPPAKRGIAMVFQSYALYPHMNLFENMAFSLRLAKLPEDRIKTAVRQAADALHIRHLLERKPKELSGGQRQRVAIGRAIVRQPKVFLFDEPLSNLDAALRVKMRYEFARLHEELKTTMIYVTHDQVEAMTLASKIVVLSEGKVEQIGRPMDLYHYPGNLFVAGFIGSPKMNFLKARMVTADSTSASVRFANGQTWTIGVDASRAESDSEVTVGVRPEHLQIGDGANRLLIDVEYVECLGDATYLYARAPDAEAGMIVRAPPQVMVKADERMTLHAAPGTCHLFDRGGRAFRRTVEFEQRPAQ